MLHGWPKKKKLVDVRLSHVVHSNENCIICIPMIYKGYFTYSQKHRNDEMRCQLATYNAHIYYLDNLLNFNLNSIRFKAVKRKENRDETFFIIISFSFGILILNRFCFRVVVFLFQRLVKSLRPEGILEYHVQERKNPFILNSIINNFQSYPHATKIHRNDLHCASQPRAMYVQE